MLNPSDHSGIVAPGLTYTFSDSVSLLATFYVLYGRPPEDGVLRSEYGAAPALRVAAVAAVPSETPQRRAVVSKAPESTSRAHCVVMTLCRQNTDVTGGLPVSRRSLTAIRQASRG